MEKTAATRCMYFVPIRVYSLLSVQLTTLEPIKAEHVATVLRKYGIRAESIELYSRKETDDAKLTQESGN